MDSGWASAMKQGLQRVRRGADKALGTGGDARFFTNTKKGELGELKNDLNSNNKEKVKEAVKKVIASMTIGKDVSSLFTDIVKSLATDQLELKKLVYLYIINYARTSPDKAILVVNTFQKDASSTSPLIRALAIRTMGCIHVDRIVEYLAEPLQRSLKDKDPYVRKTAAIGVAKLYDIAPDLVIDQQFIVQLRELISDSNPMVVANAVAALQDISTTSGHDVLKVDSALLHKLLAALNECTEWGQVFILDAISSYIPQSQREAEDTVERVTPRFKHANAAVVMSAIRVVMNYLPYITSNVKLTDTLLNEKLPPPLITLLSENRAEIQYVALRNIRLLIAKQPALLSSAIKHFFVKYNDPIYVKIEKLDILLALANAKNVDKVLLELREYATEIDVEFVRRAVNCIGRCAIKLESSAEKCVQLLLELIATKVQYVVQEAIVVIRDIFRKYPNRYESIISTLCDSLDTLDEPEAKSSMIWIIGEYADRIDNAVELLETFLSTWSDETHTVQLTLLTAVVKLFLKRPEDAKTLVGKVLQTATNEVDNPDLRDRAYIYWRLLATDPEKAQNVVLHHKPTIQDDAYNIDGSTLDTLIKNIGTLASVYHKAPEFFVASTSKRAIPLDEQDEEEEGEEGEDLEEDEDGLEDIEGDADQQEHGSSDEEESKRPTQPKAAPAVDLLGLLGESNATQPQPTQQATRPATAASAFPSLDEFQVVLTSEQGKGLQIRSRVARRNKQLSLDMYINNHSSQPLSQWAIKFNENFVGVQPNGPLSAVGTVAVNQTKPFALPLIASKAPVLQHIGVMQVAIKTDLGVFYWNQPVNPVLLFSEDGKLADSEFLSLWRQLPDQSESTLNFSSSRPFTSAEITPIIEKRNIFVVATRTINKQTQAIYASAKYRDVPVLVEIKIDGTTIHLAMKSSQADSHSLLLNGIQRLLS